MKYFRLSLGLALLSYSTFSYSAAFQFYEVGTPIIGTAGVGQAVNTQDASTSYFNPAAMTKLCGSQGLLGTQVIMPRIRFSPNNANTITGNNGGNAAMLTPGLGGFYVYQFSPRWKMGLSLTQPYGGALNYDTHWAGRYNVQQMMFYTLNLNPAVAYQINNWLGVGGGFSIEYANLYQSLAIPLTPLIDGQATLKVSNVASGVNAGILLTPNTCTQLGIAYRSQIVHHLSGNIGFLNISAIPDASTRMVMPANVIASIAQKISQKFTLLGELGWAGWSSMVNSIVTVHHFSATTPLNWTNTYRFGVGGQYHCSPALLFQGGASYDSSPTKSTRRVPDLPMDRQIRLGAGVVYDIVRSTSLGLSYEYINFGKANIFNVSSNGILSGSYSKNYANVIQASLNVSC